MRYILALLIVLALGLQQPEQYPGQASHAEPPEGWLCAPQTPDFQTPADHVCACQRVCVDDASGDNRTMEDPHCAVFCHASHCRCPVMGCGSL